MVKKLFLWTAHNGFVDALFYIGIVYNNGCATLAAWCYVFMVMCTLTVLGYLMPDEMKDRDVWLKKHAMPSEIPGWISGLHDFVLAGFLAFNNWTFTALLVLVTLVGQKLIKERAEELRKELNITPDSTCPP